MNRHIRNIALALTLLPTLWSCSDDIDLGDTSTPQGATPILFSTEVVETKGSAYTESEFLTAGVSFPLYVYKSDKSDYFNTTVTRGENSWSYSTSDGNPYYWDDEASLIFYAYNLPVSGETSTSLLNNETTGEKYIKYTSYYATSSQEDLIVAAQESPKAESVNLTFNHALSKINFTLTLKTDEANIQYVKLYYTYKNLYNNGDYYFNTTGGEWRNIGKTYTNSDEQTDLAIYNHDTQNPTHTYSEDLFLIPQKINTDTYLSVRAEYTLYNDDIENYTVSTGDLPLYSPTGSTALVSEWKQGYEYLYNLTIDTSNEMSFDVVINEREEQEAWGNIDLQYIDDYTETETRVATLINEEGDAQVLDFVIYGKYSAGVFGYSYEDNPFITAFGDECDMVNSVDDSGSVMYDENNDAIQEANYTWSTATNLTKDKLISVDLRAITNLPTFSDIHDSGYTPSEGENELTGTEPALPRQIFEHVQRLQEVMMPSEIIAIGDYGFQGCINLKTVYLENVKHIESCSFQGCYSLEEVIGDELTRIHTNGFDNCWKLTTINLKNVTQIDDYGFVECPKLGEVDLSNVVAVGKHAFDGCTEMYVAEGTHIPNLTEISMYAFAKCANLGSKVPVTIYDAVTIGEHAFNGCSSLRLPDEVENYTLDDINYIGANAFENCTNLTNINISNVTTICDDAFFGCTNMQFNGDDLSFDNLTSIGARAFQDCTALCSQQEMEIVPEQITSIGDHAFHGADLKISNTTTLDFTNLTSLGIQVFENCYYLDNAFKFSNTSITSLPYGCFSNCRSLSGLELPHVSTIGGYALNGCRSLIKLTIGGADCTVGYSAFSDMPYSKNCDLVLNSDQDSKITNNNMWSGKEWKSITFTDGSAPTDDGIFHIEYSAYWAYGVGYSEEDWYNDDDDIWAQNKAYNDARFETRLTELLSTSTEITVVGDFSDCSFTFGNASVTKYNFSELENLDGKLNLSGSFKLEEVTLPSSGTTTLGDYTFSGCSNLALPDLSEVTTIGSQVFNSCGNITSVTFPKLTTINNDAFNWSKVTSIDLSGTSEITIVGTDTPFVFDEWNPISGCTLKISASTSFIFNNEIITINDNTMTYTKADGTEDTITWGSIIVE